jgi:hypothetical protein
MGTRNDAVVDGDESASQGRYQSIGSKRVRGENAGRKVLPAPPMQREKFRFGSPGADHQQRPEMLGIEGFRVERTVEDGLRSHTPTVCRIGDESGRSTATSDRIFDEFAMPISCGGVDEVPHRSARGKRNEGGHERGMPVRMDQRSPWCHTGLARIHGHGRPDAPRGEDRIGIVQNDRGITAGEFKGGG